MPRTWPGTVLIGMALLLVASSGLEAQGTVGRLLLTVKDEQGNPIEGVRVVVTCDQLANYRDERVSNKKGKVTLAFADGTKVYKLAIMAEGYLPVGTTFKPALRKTRLEEMTLIAAASAVASGGQEPGGESERIYTAAERLLNEGVEALGNEDYDLAREKFLQALAEDPDLALAHSALGGLNVEMGDHEAAIASADKLLELEPESPRGYRILYDANTALGREEEADRALEQLAKLDRGGDATTLIFNEGVDALKVGDAKSAIARFKEALEVNPDFAPALFALAILLINEKSYEEAAATAERLLALEPNNLKAMRIAYEAHRGSGASELEKAAFDRLAAANPKVVATQFFDEGVELFNSGKIDGAIVSFERTLTADPSRTRAHYYLGLCFTNSGETDKARGHLRTFVDLAPDDPDAQIAAEMLEALGS